MLAEQLWQILRHYAPPFFRYLREKKLRGGGADNCPPPGRARVNLIYTSLISHRKLILNGGSYTHVPSCHFPIGECSWLSGPVMQMQSSKSTLALSGCPEYQLVYSKSVPSSQAPS